MRLPLFQVDAFAPEVFSGNPAAVCPLERFLPDATLQAIAAENNLSETAFFVRDGDAWRLRWFTPACEVDLCGHATLASAYVLFHELGYAAESVTFLTRSGALKVRRQQGHLAMDLPAVVGTPAVADSALARALGTDPVELLATTRDFLVRLESQEQVAHLNPDMALLAKAGKPGIIVTAAGAEVDFVSRFFAPAMGVPEDPVTGSAHSTLVPYWAHQLGKSTMRAKQIGKRGGELLCRLQGSRVELAGGCSLYLRGEIEIPVHDRDFSSSSPETNLPGRQP